MQQFRVFIMSFPKIMSLFFPLSYFKAIGYNLNSKPYDSLYLPRSWKYLCLLLDVLLYVLQIIRKYVREFCNCLFCLAKGFCKAFAKAGSATGESNYCRWLAQNVSLEWILLPVFSMYRSSEMGNALAALCAFVCVWLRQMPLSCRIFSLRTLWTCMQ